MAVFTAAAAIVIAVTLAVLDLRDARAALEARTAEAARLLEEHTIRTLEAAELVIQNVAERAGDAGMAETASAANRTRLATVVAALPYVSNIYLVQPDGRLVVDAKGFHPAGSNFADRDWVKALSGEGRVGIYVGQAAFDDASRVFAFPVAQRVVDRSGNFAGILVALIEVDYFKQFYMRLGLGQSQAFGIYRGDGAVLVRQPLRTEDIGRSFAGTALYTHMARDAVGTFRGRSPYDTVSRVVSYRAIPGRDLVVWAGMAEDSMLDGWRTRAFAMAALLVLVLAAVLGLTALLLRELNREERASAELVNLNRDLERSNADLEQFAYVASHDLKEPLRNIASYVQLLQRRYQGRLDPDADAFIGYTVDGVRRMQSIINELLAYSRIGTGQLTLVPVQAGILVSTALAHLKGVIAEAQAVVEVKGPLPVVEADAAQLGSLFQNLIGNALKYRRDDARPEVVVGCEDRGDRWEFFVQDNGIGIDQQYHRQIFDLFKRLHPRDRYPGSGIGLAICQRVVERHGGRIWVESQAGKGSTFWFSLPKRRPE
jgi:signal transduction histidine kinase